MKPRGKLFLEVEPCHPYLMSIIIKKSKLNLNVLYFSSAYPLDIFESYGALLLKMSLVFMAT